MLKPCKQLPLPCDVALAYPAPNALNCKTSMSALGQKQTSRLLERMSALHRKADIDISIASSVIRRESSMLGMPQLGEPLRFVLRLRHDCAGFHYVACWVVLNADEQLLIFEPGHLMQHRPQFLQQLLLYLW